MKEMGGGCVYLRLPMQILRTATTTKKEKKIRGGGERYLWGPHFFFFFAELQEICAWKKNKTIPALCEVYKMDDTKYEAKIKQGAGRVKDFPITTIHLISF